MSAPVTKSPPKALGPVRWKGLLIFAVIMGLFSLYFKFFFDTHLKKAMEWGGYLALGSEINISDIDSSFLKGFIKIKDIQVTNAEKPTHNSVQIGEITFDLSIDALLRLKAVVEEMKVEKLQLDTKRKSVGKVKPPEPPKKGPSAMEAATQRAQMVAIESINTQAEGNLLSDLTVLLQGQSGDDVLKNIESQLESKILIQNFDKKVKELQTTWDAKKKALPKPEEAKAIEAKFKSIKTNNFKNIQEVQSSIQAFDSVIKEADSKIKTVQQTANDFNSDFSSIQKDFKDIESAIQRDKEKIQNKLKVPQLDAKNIALSIFQDRINGYVAKLNRYRTMAEKYIPPKFLGKPGLEKVQAQPRAKGISYEFPKENAYPLFWIKLVKFSSVAQPGQEFINFTGEVTDITSNQKQIGKPTVLNAKGDAPSMSLPAFSLSGVADGRGPLFEVSYKMAAGPFPTVDAKLIEAKEGSIVLQKADTQFSSEGFFKSDLSYSFAINSVFKAPQFSVTSENAQAQSIIQSIFSKVGDITLDASAKGVAPKLDLALRSSIGDQLSAGFNAVLDEKIKELRTKADQEIQKLVGKEKEKIQGELGKLGLADKETKNLLAAFENPKNLGQKQMDEVKRSGEKQAQRALESEAKKLLGNDADKKLEELKKKLKF